MTDAKPQDKKEKLDPSVLLGHTDHADRAASKLRTEAHADVTDKTKAAPAHNSEPVNWRSELQHATTEMQKLETLKRDHTNNPATEKERKELIHSIDQHFQKALPLVQRDATAADKDLLMNVAKATESENKLQHFKVNGHDINMATAKMDDIHNAILNAPDEATRKELTRAALMREHHDLVTSSVGESYWNSKAPQMVAMDYADFLLKHKDGVSKFNGQAYTASDVLQQTMVHSMSQEIAASAPGQNLIRLARESATAHQNTLISSEKNPMVSLERAAEATDPQVRYARLQQAVALSKDNYFDPAKMAGRIADAQKDHSPEGVAKLAALQDLSTARAKAEFNLAHADLSLPAHKNEAMDHLLASAKDPSTVMNFADGQGHSVFAQELRKATAGGEQGLITAMNSYNDSIQATAAHRQKYEALVQAKDYDGAAKELKAASASADETLKGAKAINAAIGDDNAKKIKDEYDDLNKKPQKTEADKAMIATLKQYVDARGFESQAMMDRATLQEATGNHNVAAAQLADLQKFDPSFATNPEHKQNFDELSKTVKDGVDYDNASWLGKRWMDAESIGSAAWEFMKKHEKLVATVAAIGAAAAITVASGGLGAPIAAAMVIGVVGGAAVGTAAGAGMELASGRKHDFASAALDVAPSAVTGAVTGALIAGTGGASLFAEAEGGAAVGGETVAGKLAMPGTRFLFNALGQGRVASFAANSLRAAEIAAPYSALNASENYRAGRDQTLGSAAADFLKTDVSLGLAGGLATTSWAAGRFLGPVLTGGAITADTALSGVYFSNSYLLQDSPSPLATRIDGRSLKLPDASSQRTPDDEESVDWNK